MAGKIQWAIEFTGLDTALLKLKEIDRTLQRISRHQGSTFLGSPNAGGPNGGKNVVVPRGGGAAAGAAAGLATGGVVATDIKGMFLTPVAKEFLNTSKDFRKLMEDAAKGKTGEISVPGNPLGLDDGGKKKRNLGRPFPPPKGFLDLRPLAEKWTPKPPVIKQDIMENLQKHMQSFGKAMQATGIPGVSQLGGMLMKMGKLGLVVGLVVFAAVALYQAFKLLMKGAEEAARVYQEAAKSGIGVQKTSQLEQALKALGITESPTFQMRSAAAGGASAGGIIGAARGSGFGGAQQLQNMGKEFAAAMKDAENSSRQMELSSKAGQMLSMDMVAISREWKTMLAEAAANMYPILHGVFEMVKAWMQLYNLYMEMLLKLKEWVSKKLGIDILPTGGPGQSRWPGGGGGGLPGAGSWEKIGLVFGKGGFSTAMQQTADNTKQISTNTSKTLEVLKMALKAGIFGPVGVAASFAP